MKNTLHKTVLGLGLVGFLVLSPAVAQQPGGTSAENWFQRGFFLQVHEHDLAGAAAAFEKVATDSAAPEALHRQAQARLAQVREDIAAANLAESHAGGLHGLCRNRRTGRARGRILKMMDLIDPPGRRRSGRGKAGPTGQGLVLAGRFHDQPGAGAELKKIPRRGRRLDGRRREGTAGGSGSHSSGRLRPGARPDRDRRPAARAGPADRRLQDLPHSRHRLGHADGAAGAGFRLARRAHRRGRATAQSAGRQSGHQRIVQARAAGVDRRTGSSRSSTGRRSSSASAPC